MSKRIISIFLFLLIVCTVSGCGEQYPTVLIRAGASATGVTIDIGKPYVYKDFDIETIDGGKDLILHFTEGKE